MSGGKCHAISHCYFNNGKATALRPAAPESPTIYDCKFADSIERISMIPIFKVGALSTFSNTSHLLQIFPRTRSSKLLHRNQWLQRIYYHFDSRNRVCSTVAAPCTVHFEMRYLGSWRAPLDLEEPETADLFCETEKGLRVH
jgi:hypothetical protein